MSVEYDLYLANHKENVGKAFNWLKNHMPELFNDIDVDINECEWLITYKHDDSKTKSDEYSAYDTYFYGENKSYKAVQNFKKAWLNHIHRNPHHWQHWVLINDDPDDGVALIEIPPIYVVEMICDWWSFSWNNGELTGVFDWYKEHKEHIQLEYDTRLLVESILDQMMKKLEGAK